MAYLQCAGSGYWQLHGGRDLSPEGRVAQRKRPTTCDCAAVEATRFARAGLPHPGPLHECIHCNEWICERCGRDDAPPRVCRECPELLKARRSLGGCSVLDPTRAKMPQADPKGLQAASGRPVPPGKSKGKRVDCDTAFVRAREAEDAADAAGAKGTVQGVPRDTHLQLSCRRRARLGPVVRARPLARAAHRRHSLLQRWGCAICVRGASSPADSAILRSAARCHGSPPCSASVAGSL